MKRYLSADIEIDEFFDDIIAQDWLDRQKESHSEDNRIPLTIEEYKEQDRRIREQEGLNRKEFEIRCSWKSHRGWADVYLQESSAI